MDTEKQKFISDELFKLVINATFGRSKTYKDSAKVSKKEKLKKALRHFLEEKKEKYISGHVLENEHIGNIKKLSRDLTGKFPDCLFKVRFRIGSAQKALNLYLKYLWCTT